MSLKKPTSERLQMKKFKESNPKEFEEKDHCILYFMDEVRYSLVERKMIDGKANIMSLVTVKDGSKKYTATLMFVGTKDDCKERLNAMDNAPTINRDVVATASNRDPPKSRKLSREEGTIVQDINSEFKKLEKLVSTPRVNQQLFDDRSDDSDDLDNYAVEHVAKDSKRALRGSAYTATSASFDDTWRNDINTKLDKIMKKVSSIEDHLLVDQTCAEKIYCTPPSSKKMKQEDINSEASGSSSSSVPSLMYKEINLLAIPSGGDIKKYSLRVFAQLFKTEEMAEGIVDPARDKGTCKTELDATRINLLKRAIKEKFGENQYSKKWPQIRQSLNQKCLDSKRKLPKMESNSSQNAI